MSQVPVHTRVEERTHPCSADLGGFVHHALHDDNGQRRDFPCWNLGGSSGDKTPCRLYMGTYISLLVAHVTIKSLRSSFRGNSKIRTRTAPRKVLCS